ncbi:MAG: DEAD/DEAH box helicase [bacterium]
MIILHGAFAAGQFWIWGEAAPSQAPDGRTAERIVNLSCSASPGASKRGASAASSQRRGRKTKEPAKAAPELFAYDAGSGCLSAALSEVAGIPLEQKRIVPMIAWLPTDDGQALASSPLIAGPPESVKEIALRPWSVSSAPLSIQETVQRLCACIGREMLAAGIHAGADLSFWAAALRFAGALVAGQQFLPSMVEEQGAHYARWKPVFAGPNAARLAELARLMPQACRALSASMDAPPAGTPISALTSFLGLSLDCLVRAQPGGNEPAAEKLRPQKRKPPDFDSIHDQWLHALHSPNGMMTGGAASLSEFSVQVREWQRPVSLIAEAPFRICFRLEEPPLQDEFQETSGDVSWTLRYLLQAADDPSLLIPAADAWKPAGRTAVILKRGSFKPREYLLMALGQASRLCERIEASLRSKSPWGCELDSTGAYEFLTEKAMELEMAGFGVMLPAWWSRKGTKQRLSLRANVKSPAAMAGGSMMRFDTIVKFDYEVALGAEKLTLAELEALAKLKAPLVKIRGQWVHMSAEDIRTAMDFWQKSKQGQAPVRDVVRMALGAGAAGVSLPVRGVTASGRIGELLAQLDGQSSFESVPPPGGFDGLLRPYQQRGFSWLCFLRRWGLGACLADDMGLGKTIQALVLIQRDWEDDPKTRRPVLLICPMSVVGNWQKEAARFTPGLPVMVHHGSGRTKGGSFKQQADKHAIVISSYALLHRDLDLFMKVGWAGVILDEAQNIKNAETKQSKAARAIGADYRIALTGTPVENNVGDLWAIMEFINPDFLGSRNQFIREFFVPIQAERDHEAEQKLKRVTRPFILRRLKTDKSIIADLPEKMEMKVFCTLTKEQASLYAAVLKDAEEAMKRSEGIQRKGIILAMLSKLKQVCNHPAQFLGDNSEIAGRSGKLARLGEMMEEILGAGERALVFTQFAEMGSLLQRHLQDTFGREVLFLHGGIGKKQRDRMVERFQADGSGPDVFILSLKAGGTGLNLTRASHVFHFDRWWNPAVENQATDRAFRIGQTKNVQVHKFICVGTMEERIDEMIELKSGIARNVVGAGEQWLTEMSNKQIKELFALRKEAVAE